MSKQEIAARVAAALGKVIDLATHLNKLHDTEADLKQLKADLVTSFSALKVDINKLIADLETPDEAPKAP